MSSSDTCVPVEPYSLHINIAAMGVCREQMDRFGMLAGGEPEPFPSFPEWERSAYGSEIEHRLANPDVWEAYEDAEHLASIQRGKGLGIARFKLESNGPWVVVAEEIQTALSAYEGVSPSAQVDAEKRPALGGLAWLAEASNVRIRGELSPVIGALGLGGPPRAINFDDRPPHRLHTASDTPRPAKRVVSSCI